MCSSLYFLFCSLFLLLLLFNAITLLSIFATKMHVQFGSRIYHTATEMKQTKNERKKMKTKIIYERLINYFETIFLSVTTYDMMNIECHTYRHEFYFSLCSSSCSSAHFSVCWFLLAWIPMKILYINVCFRDRRAFFHQHQAKIK